MASAWTDRHFKRAGAFLARDLDLPQRAVLIVGTLQDQKRYPDMGQIFRDVPRPESGIEPRAIPPIEGVIDVAMPAGEPCAQTCDVAPGCLIGLLDSDNRGEINILN